MTTGLPDIEQIMEARARIGARVVRTPVVALEQESIAGRLPRGTNAAIKLELFQHAGSFKARGNLLGAERLDAAQRAAGVVAASGGNHAMALAWAAASVGVHARLVMPRGTDPYRVDYCRRMGAAVDLIEKRTEMFDVMDRIAASEGRVVMHPFNAEHMVLGSGTIGLEILEDLPEIDMMVVSVGGGGLIGGIASAIKQRRPECEVIGVEPFGADSLYRSLEAGEPVQLDSVSTIADSLASPLALPYSFAIAQRHVDAVVRIGDGAMLETMVLMRDALKIMAEPACAAALAALVGPLAERAVNRKVCVIACGSNIGLPRYLSLLERSQRRRTACTQIAQSTGKTPQIGRKPATGPVHGPAMDQRITRPITLRTVEPTHPAIAAGLARDGWWLEDAKDVRPSRSPQPRRTCHRGSGRVTEIADTKRQPNGGGALMFDTVKILVVDDDPHVRETIRVALDEAGMDVAVAGNGSEGLAHFIVRPSDLIVLDVGMPEMDGLEMCRRIRRSSDVPILFLSARNDEIDRILGLEIGGDDYVVKPFSPRELIARIKAILKRNGRHVQGDAAEPMRHGDLSLDPAAHRAVFDGRPVGLTALEFGIVQGLMSRPAVVFRKHQLVTAAYGPNMHVSDRTVDSHIRNIRAKLLDAGCANAVETVHGVGFRLGPCTTV